MAADIEQPPAQPIPDKPKRKRHGVPSKLTQRLYKQPWWLFILVVLWVIVVIQISRSEEYSEIYAQLSQGISLTLYIAVMSYLFGLIIGLVTGTVRAFPPQPVPPGSRIMTRIKSLLHLIAYNVVTLYIEFMRGIPPLVFLLVSGFIIVPALRDVVNTGLIPFLRDLLNDPNIAELTWRGRDPATAIAGLSVIYGAFLSEVFRGGILSVDRGQIEAAKSLGMRNIQIMRHIIVPQAFRNMLPPLGNDFISMIKDTSLVTILGTQDITQLARKWSGSTFLYLETYAVLTLIYLTMTVSGSILVQMMERYLRRNERG